MANEAVSSGVSQEALDIAKKQGTLRYQIVRNRASYFMIAPYFILFFFFTVLPVLMSIGLSFTYFNMLELPTFVGWKNYIKLFLEDDVFLISEEHADIRRGHGTCQLYAVPAVRMDYQ